MKINILNELFAQPCFHGLQRPQADDLRALILRWLSLVLTGVLNEALCGTALLPGHAALVVWPQVPPPFRRGNLRVLEFVCHWSSCLHAQFLGLKRLRLAERLDAIAVEAFTGGEGFGGKATVDGGFNAQHKLAAEFLFAQRVRHFVAVRVNQFDHFFRCHAQFGVHLRFVVPVNAAQHEFGATANEALVFIAPLDKFGVSRCLFSNLLACHKSSLFKSVQAAGHVRQLVEGMRISS
jgi:hypothetical protein